MIDQMNFSQMSIDEALEALQVQASDLSRPKMAAFCALMGEALLPLYDKFSGETGWGDAGLLREAITAALSFAAGGPNLAGVATGLLESIDNVTPDGGVFDAPGSTFAQDTAICAAAAVRASDPNEAVDSLWIEYALEPATTMVCEHQTGYLDLGSSKEADDWRKGALGHVGLRQAFEALSEMISLLKEKEVNVSDIETLRRLATKLIVDLPTVATNRFWCEDVPSVSTWMRH
jgi:hypothetical protein